MEGKEKKAAVFISDKRMGVIARELKRHGIQVIEIENPASFEKLEGAARELDWLLLPIRGVDRAGKAQMNGCAYPVSSLLEKLPETALVFTGLWTDYLLELSAKWEQAGCGKKIFCYFDDPDIVAENARLTAEGLLYFLMEKTPASIFTYTVDLIGYGRVGKEIAALLEKLGIAIRIVKERLDGREDLWTLDYRQWRDRQPSDVIINTAPVTVITQEIAKNWKKDVLIIEIASGQAGVEAEVGTLPGIRVEPAPTLPGLVTWESAGMMLSDYLLNRQFDM